jgi:hypothetical protein
MTPTATPVGEPGVEMFAKLKILDPCICSNLHGISRPQATAVHVLITGTGTGSTDR